MIRKIILTAFVLTVSSCNQDLIQEWERWIDLYNIWNYEKASSVFEILMTKSNNKKISYNFATSLYKNWEHEAAYEQFIEIKNESFSEKWSIEYQIWNTSYKLWEKQQRIKAKINYYQEAIEYYNFWLTKKPKKDLEEKLKQNIEFVKNKLEKEKRKKEIMDNIQWRKSQQSSWEKAQKYQHTNKGIPWLIKEISKLQKEEIKLQNNFNRFGDDDFLRIEYNIGSDKLKQRNLKSVESIFDLAADTSAARSPDGIPIKSKEKIHDLLEWLHWSKSVTFSKDSITKWKPKKIHQDKKPYNAKATIQSLIFNHTTTKDRVEILENLLNYDNDIIPLMDNYLN